MSKLFFTFVLSSAVLVAPAFAQQVTYACQYVETAGLGWKNGKWVPGTYVDDPPFFLTAEGNSLTSESLEKIFGSFGYSCNPPLQSLFGESQSCVGSLGTTINFSFTNLTGVRAATFAGIKPSNRSEKGYLLVAPFVCEKVR